MLDFSEFLKVPATYRFVKLCEYASNKLLYGDNVFEKRGIRRDRTGGSGKGRYLQGKTGILKRDGPASASVSLKMFEREGVDVVGVLFFAPRAAESPQEPRAASGACDIGKPPKA